MPAPDVLIHARGLAKKFGDSVAVAGIDFDLRRGEAFGFLGPNGAGKSSTMRMIGCVSPPSGGELTILGLDPVADGPAIRARLGVVPQEDTLAFIVVMLALGLVHSAWAVFDLPVALLIGFAAAAAGMSATTFMRSWQHFEFIMLATLPMFLFSATFYPLSVYPRPVQILVECTPLYQGVALMRGLTFGVVGPGLLWHAAYLALMGLAGLYVAGRRIGRLLLR
jgi:hypothetical protein